MTTRRHPTHRASTPISNSRRRFGPSERSRVPIGLRRTASSALGFGLGPAAGAVIGLATVPLTAWLFKPDDVGRLNVAQTALQAGVIALSLGLDQAYVRWFHESANPSQLFAKVVRIAGLTTVVVLGLSIPLGTQLSRLMFATPDAKLVWLLGLALLFSVGTRFLSLPLRMRGRGLAFSAGQIAPKVVLVGGLVLVKLGFFPRNFRTLALLLMLSMLAGFAAYVVATPDRGTKTSARDDSSPRELLAFSAPLILSSFVYWGLSATTTITLRAFASLHELGVYGLASSIAAAAAIFQVIFSTIWAPVIYRWHARGPVREQLTVVARLTTLVALLAVSLATAASPLIAAVLPRSYAGVGPLIACSVVPTALYAVSEVTGIGIYLERRTWLSLWATGAALVVNVGLSIPMVMSMGVRGAVFANVLAYAVFYLGRSELSGLVMRDRFARSTYPWIALMLLVSALSLATGTMATVVAFVAMIVAVWSILVSRRPGLDLLRILGEAAAEPTPASTMGRRT